MKVDRLLNILMLLINRKKMTAKELADYFSVSVRTIQRDIDKLSLAGVPIYADVGSKGGYQLMDHYKLEKNFLKSSEAKVLVNFLHSLENAVPHKDLKSMTNKFMTLMEEDLKDDKLVIQLNPNVEGRNMKDMLHMLSEAREDQKKMRLTYYDLYLNKTSRTISPYTMVMMGMTWYIYGYCDLRNDFRLFRVSRIRECELLEESFELKEPPKPYPWEYDMDFNRPCTNIKLEVEEAVLSRLPECFGYEECQKCGDKIIIEVNYPVDEWLYSALMTMVPNVKILEPSWLRDEFVERLQRALEKNSI